MYKRMIIGISLFLAFCLLSINLFTYYLFIILLPKYTDILMIFLYYFMFHRQREFKYQPGDILVSDLANTAENLILQIACSRIGVGYATVKDSSNLDALTAEKPGRVRGVVTTDQSGFLSSAKLFHPAIFASDDDIARGLSLAQLFHSASLPTASTDVPLNSSSVDWGYFNSVKPLSCREVEELGASSATYLKITEKDAVCVSITLCHPFGIGSACAGALMSGPGWLSPQAKSL
jgi:hypothetical protein